MTLKQFKQVMSDGFQGIDPELDIYYWNLWNDTLKHNPKADWCEFLDAIAKEKI